MNILTKILIGVTGIISIHWLLMQIYLFMCVRSGLWGFLTSFITMGSPVCQFINMLQYELARHYISIWATAGTALVTWLVAKNTIVTSN